MEELGTGVVGGEASRCRCRHGIVETVEKSHSRYIIRQNAGDGEHEIDAPNPLCRCGDTWMQLGLDRACGFGGKHLGLSAYERWQQGDGEEHDTQSAYPLCE